MTRRGEHIRAFTGLDNKHEPESLIQLREGVSALTDAINVDITDRGNLKRRQGFASVASGEFHSLWAVRDGSRAFVVEAGALSELDAAYGRTSLVSVGEQRVCYAEANHEIYFSNGQVIGVINGTTVTMLDKAGVYNFPTRTAIDISEDVDFYDSPPPAVELDYWSGRLWAVSDGVVWYSKPFFPNRFDFRQDFIPVEGSIFIRGIDSGAYLATDTNVIYLAGRDPKAFTVREVCNHGAVPGTALVTQGERLGIEGASGPCVLWESKTHGKMLGLSGGQVRYLTEESFSFPTGAKGASLLREQGGMVQHISVFPSAGESAQNFRASDIAEAEIRRNGVIIT